MSLINDMLKDLEQRNANAPGATPIAGDVHSVAFAPASGSYRWLWIILLIMVLAGAGYALFGIYQPQLDKKKLAVPAKSAVPAMPAPVPQAPPPEVLINPAPADITNAAQGAPENNMVYALDRELRSMSAQSVQPVTPMVADKPTPPAAPPPKADLPAQSATEVSDSVKEPAVSKPAQTVARSKTTGPLPVKQVSPQQRSANLYRQGVDLIQQGRVAESTSILQQALEINPANHDARQLLVGVWLDGKRNSEAISLLRDGLAVDPAQSGFSISLARLLVESGDRRAAMGVMEKGLATAGEDAEYHAFMAHLLQREERHTEAVQHYLIALRTNPAMPSWLIGIGISLQAEKMNSDAITAFQRAIDTAQLSPELQQFAEQRLKQLRQQTQ